MLLTKKKLVLHLLLSFVRNFVNCTSMDKVENIVVLVINMKIGMNTSLMTKGLVEEIGVEVMVKDEATIMLNRVYRKMNT